MALIRYCLTRCTGLLISVYVSSFQGRDKETVRIRSHKNFKRDLCKILSRKPSSFIPVDKNNGSKNRGVIAVESFIRRRGAISRFVIHN